ncbi:MAG: nicotinate-nucleotide adenylyltransferase [Myxococcota bacterium]
MRVAVYGGSFDPPHVAHVLVATWATCLTRDGGPAFDEVRLVPVAGHAFGKKLTPFEVRCAMLADAVRHLGPRVVVDPIEASLPAPSYTVDTLRAMVAREPGLEATLVMGTDAWADRRKWREWDALAALVGGRFLVLGRAGAADPDDGSVSVDVHLPAISSTEIRRRAKAGEPYEWMVPMEVAARIARDGLYR